MGRKFENTAKWVHGLVRLHAIRANSITASSKMQMGAADENPHFLNVYSNLCAALNIAKKEAVASKWVRGDGQTHLGILNF